MLTLLCVPVPWLVIADGLVSDPLSLAVKTIVKFLLEIMKSDLNDAIFKKLKNKPIGGMDDVVTMSVAVTKGHRKPSVTTGSAPGATTLYSAGQQNKHHSPARKNTLWQAVDESQM